MIDPKSVVARVEGWVDPPSPEEGAMLARLDAHLDAVLPPGRGAALEASATFPDAELRAFAAEGFVEAFVPVDLGGALDWGRAMRVAARYAAHDLDVALCLAGTVLGAMPFLMAGDAAQRAAYFGSMRRGEMGGFGLSEWSHGSDLLAVETRAEGADDDGRPCAPERATRFRLTGTKAPTNNGTRGELVVVLARTGDGDGTSDPFAYSLVVVPRATAGRRPGPRFAPTGFRNMDLSGVGLDGAEVGRDAVLGAVGQGFAYARRSLEVTRSGVAGVALGPHAACLALALDHARTRSLYGAPIEALGAVRGLVGGVFARFVEAVALSRRASRAAARFPASARALTAAAKLRVPALLEASVHDAGTLLGARSLMEDLPFARLRRAAPVLAIFDGSSQLQLDEIWRYVAPWAPPPGRAPRAPLTPARALELGRALRDQAPVPFDGAAADGEGILDAASPLAILEALDGALPGRGLAALARAAAAVTRFPRGGRDLDQPSRFRLSEIAATLYGLTALAEATALATADLDGGAAGGRDRLEALEALEALDAALAVRVAASAAPLAEALLALGPHHPDGSLVGEATAVLMAAAGLDGALARAYAAASGIR